jgi:hypothetical protein
LGRIVPSGLGHLIPDWPLVGELAVAAVLAAVLVVRGLAKTGQSRVRKHGGHVLAWRWLSGHPWHGRPLTDAGWVRPGTKALTPSGHATRWHHLPRWKRAAWRSGGTLTALAAGWSLLVNPQVTATAIICICFVFSVAAAVLATRSLLGRRRRRTWLLPLHLAAHELAGIPRAALASSWISVELDEGKAVTGARLALPPGWPAEGTDKARLVAIASAKLGIEAPEATWRLAGPQPQLVLSQSEPPPARVTLESVRAAIDAARPDDLVWGTGKQAAVVKTSLSGDSPHLGLSMGSGAGKSVTARGLLAQRLYRGDIGLILDYKMISHQWARDLPNVMIARRPHEIHRALIWLGGEVERRNEVALAGADIDGNVHSVVGPRLIVVCEELNATVARLRAHWRDVRAGDRDLPQRSPALEALDSVSFMGRQVLVNIFYIGQRLSVKASGGDGDARENIGVLAFSRYSASNWKMLAGDYPMPPKSLTPGRLQVVTDRVRETQGVFMSAREARALALAGTVTPLPAGMPGAVSGTPRVSIDASPEQGLSQSYTTPLPVRGGPVILSEAVADGLVSLKLGALRKASQRPGFPPHTGMRGLAKEYDALALADWDEARKAAPWPMNRKES